MRKLRRFWKRLGSWTHAQQSEARLQAEIEEHLALQADEFVRSGLSAAEARRQAVLKFGAMESVREEVREQSRAPFLDSLAGDTRHTLRRLRSSPAFTITTILTLALGIGATTSIFTLVHAVVLRSLAVANPSELYRLGREAQCCYHGGYSEDKEFSLVSYDLYKHFRDRTAGFSELAAFPAAGMLFGIEREGVADPAQTFPGEFVSGNYFAMFGVGAIAGRMLRASDDQPNAPPAAVMGYRLWQQRYGSGSSVVGSVFDINNKPFTVVGITPPGFYGDTLRNTPPDFFLPLSLEPLVEGDQDLNHPNTHWLELIGRIRPGARPAAIEAEMRVELKQWLRSHWGEMSAKDRVRFPEQTVYLRPGGAGITSMREQYEHWLRVLMMVSGFVLLIVCANVAALMLVRGMERRQQTSLSMALGARAWRVVQQALTEAIVLSAAGGLAGLLIAFAGTRLILHFAFPAPDGLAGVPISAAPSLPVLLFACGVSLLTGLGFGIAPAWMASRVNPIEALRGASRSTAVRSGSLPRKTLVVFQAALSLVLLCASGLLTTALYKQEHQDFGFAQERRVVVNINPRLAGYQTAQLTPLYARIRESLSSVPAISAVALCTYSPQNGNAWGADIRVEGHSAKGPREEFLAAMDRVTAGYFDATGNPILRGRAISEQDTADSPHVAVVNEAFARKFLKGEDPIGKHFGRSGPESSREYEIVGVARDARYLTFDLDKPISPFFFLPQKQHDYAANAGGLSEYDPSSHLLHDVVIVTRPGDSLSVSQIRKALGAADPHLPIVSIGSLRDQVSGEFRQQRLVARLTSFFGLLSLLLSSIGIYGVTAYNAGRRVNEIGVRMALGADRRDAVALLLRGALVLIFVGLAIGLPLSLAAGRVLGNLLYGMSPYDPVVISAAVVTLGLSAAAASLIPALRASMISPLEALRAE